MYIQGKLRDNGIYVKDFDEGFSKEVARGGVCAITCSFNGYFSVFASRFVFLKDEARIDAAKSEGV